MDVTVELPDFDEALPLLMQLYGWNEPRASAASRVDSSSTQMRPAPIAQTTRSAYVSFSSGFDSAAAY